MMPRRGETSGISHQLSAARLDPSAVKGRRQETRGRCCRHLSGDGMSGFLEISLSVDKRGNRDDGFGSAFPFLNSQRMEIPSEETWVNRGGSRKIPNPVSLSFTKKSVTKWSILRGLGHQRGETHDTKYSMHAREKGCTRKARGEGSDPKAA